MKQCSLYIHIPFCKSKCKYCAFTSFTNCLNKVNLYFDKLIQELQYYNKQLRNYEILSIYIGGGTPSFVDAEYIENLLSYVKNNYNLMNDCEISMEANPDSVTLEKAQIWVQSGINRISVGLQSDDDNVLKQLGRPHNFEQYKNTINILKSVGFNNINTDILLSLPNQTGQSIKRTIKNVVEMGVTHISAYSLMIENGTKLFEEVERGMVTIPDEENAVNMYNLAYNELKKYGYNRYEISNFAKSNYECKHNLNYWARGEFLGVGVSAYSFLNREHWNNTSDLQEYLTQPYKKYDMEQETLRTAMEESIMLALRCEKGLNIAEFNSKYNVDFEQKYQQQLTKLLSNNLVKIENGFLKIIDFEISNYIISEFFE